MTKINFDINIRLVTALKEADGDWLLNGGEVQQKGHPFVSLGTKFLYETDGMEKLTARGPLLNDLSVMVC